MNTHLSLLPMSIIEAVTGHISMIIEWYYIISVVLECHMLEFHPSKLKCRIPNSYLMWHSARKIACYILNIHSIKYLLHLKQAKKFKSCKIKDEGWRGVLICDEWTKICDSRVAFAPENILINLNRRFMGSTWNNSQISSLWGSCWCFYRGPLQNAHVDTYSHCSMSASTTSMTVKYRFCLHQSQFELWKSPGINLE